MIKIKIKILFLVSKSGIKTFIGHSPKNIKGVNIIVKSTAIKNNNIEIKYAKKIKFQFIVELWF